MAENAGIGSRFYHNTTVINTERLSLLKDHTSEIICPQERREASLNPDIFFLLYCHSVCTLWGESPKIFHLHGCL